MPTKGYSKEISPKEKEFVELMVNSGLGAIEAARQVLGWRCEPGSREAQKAMDIGRSKRCLLYRQEYEQRRLREAQAIQAIKYEKGVDLDKLRDLAYKKLLEIATDTANKNQVRYVAVKALEDLTDPSKDISLILKWIALVWRGLNAHCPSCHNTFPLWKVKNETLNEYIEETDDPIKEVEDVLDRRLAIISRAEKRKEPHPGQIKLLAAPERHIVGTGAARCLEENERIILSDGRVVPIKEVKNTIFNIPAFGVLGEQVSSKAWATNNGIKEVFKVSLSNGKEIIRTGNHPLLVSKKQYSGQGKRTQIGKLSWIKIEDLVEGDLVAAPTKLNVEGNNRQDERLVKLLGYLLGDGGLTQSITFTQKDGPAKQEFKEIVESLGFKCSVANALTYRVVKNNSKKGKNDLWEWIKSLGLQCKSKDKFIPEFIWSLPNDQLALFLNRVFACDGYALKKGEIGISLASEKFIRDIEIALLRLGIFGRVRSRIVGNQHKRGFKAWAIDISRAEYVIKFALTIGIKGKETNIQTALESANKKNKNHIGWETSGLPDGYIWLPIKRIESIGLRPTINITVDTYHTFITTVVEHNSGKSFTLAMFAFLTLLIPGVEVWILAQVYESARKEIDYLRSFIRTAFHPFSHHIFKETYDTKTGELILTTKWGSELRVRSAKAKGSITASELEMALIAEPGWVPDEIFNHLRARMSSRLGRIILLGTPQGFGGILGRMVNAIGRDPKTNKVIRIPPEERTIEAGCPWNISMLYYKLEPSQNPEYVKSELGAARMELMDEEYATEFEGEMSATEGALFPQIKPFHLIPIHRDSYMESSFVLGVDQGPKNFAYVIVGWDGKIAKVAFDNYDPEPRTMKSKMLEMRHDVPAQIIKMGGLSDNLRLTIFDTDPPLTNELRELEQEGRPWMTPFTFKHRNLKSRVMHENWRKETYEFINELAVQGRLIFDAEYTQLLHDDLTRVQRKLSNQDIDVDRGYGKGWEANNPWRKDHVMDAFILAMWTIMIGQVPTIKETPVIHDAFSEAKKGFEYDFAKREREALSGFAPYGRYTPETAEELFEEKFGRVRDPNSGQSVLPPSMSPYKDY